MWEPPTPLIQENFSGRDTYYYYYYDYYYYYYYYYSLSLSLDRDGVRLASGRLSPAVAAPHILCGPMIKRAPPR